MENMKLTCTPEEMLHCIKKTKGTDIINEAKQQLITVQTILDQEIKVRGREGKTTAKKELKHCAQTLAEFIRNFDTPDIEYLQKAKIGRPIINACKSITCVPDYEHPKWIGNPAALSEANMVRAAVIDQFL